MSGGADSKGNRTAVMDFQNVATTYDEETAKELAIALKEADAADFVSETDFWKQMKARRQK